MSYPYRYKIQAHDQESYQNALGLFRMHGQEPALKNPDRLLIAFEGPSDPLWDDLLGLGFNPVQDGQYAPEAVVDPAAGDVELIAKALRALAATDKPKQQLVGNGMCQTCVHWHSLSLDSKGECHRHAPVPAGLLMGEAASHPQDGVWPDNIEPKNSCGDYAAGIPKLGHPADR